MLRTIMIGNYSMVQGRYVKTLSDGRIVVRVGHRLHIGWPVTGDMAA
ncbi:hypothetical protein ALP8811_02950 [Aliiroseovarius pelagivivens]|uniref:Uncharacterized protein n=1 Tax=Aliiroseovarius pelagivivens TaxID=1639690 RepID=A0A2R8ASI4_9RHOB|nr:hypothetical protein [Aliiroseovarius pelagivivens]SPF79016.1 hypothetical protein ALP8811_02950 [Aliiroseovarius pelagivivens]